jgi:hypothetical protein
MLRIELVWPTTADAANPVISVAGTSATVSPIRSAALAQPLPSVRAMSWRATPVFSAISAAAVRATSKGSAARSSSGCVVVSDMASTLGSADGPPRSPRGPARGQSMLSRTCPDETVSPTTAAMPETVPSRWAATGCSIFIASSTSTRSPLTTC